MVVSWKSVTTFSVMLLSSERCFCYAPEHEAMMRPMVTISANATLFILPFFQRLLRNPLIFVSSV